MYVPASNGTVTTVGGPLHKSIKVLGTPFQAVFTPDGSEAFVSNLSGYISVINTATGSFTNIGTAPGSVGLVITGNTLYATSVNEVFVIDTRHRKSLNGVHAHRRPYNQLENSK